MLRFVTRSSMTTILVMRPCAAAWPTGEPAACAFAGAYRVDAHYQAIGEKPLTERYLQATLRSRLPRRPSGSGGATCVVCYRTREAGRVRPACDDESRVRRLLSTIGAALDAVDALRAHRRDRARALARLQTAAGWGVGARRWR